MFTVNGLNIYHDEGVVSHIGHPASGRLLVINDQLPMPDGYDVADYGRGLTIVVEHDNTRIHVVSTRVGGDGCRFMLIDGVYDVLLKFVKMPVEFTIQMYVNGTSADRAQVRSHLISFVMDQHRRYKPADQGLILTMLRMLAMLGDIKTFRELVGNEDKPNYMALVGADTFTSIGKRVLTLLYGKHTLPDSVDFTTIVIEDAQPQTTTALTAWVQAQGITVGA